MRTDGRTDGEKAAKGSSISRPLPPSLSLARSVGAHSRSPAGRPVCPSLRLWADSAEHFYFAVSHRAVAKPDL